MKAILGFVWMIFGILMIFLGIIYFTFPDQNHAVGGFVLVVGAVSFLIGLLKGG